MDRSFDSAFRNNNFLVSHFPIEVRTRLKSWCFTGVFISNRIDYFHQIEILSDVCWLTVVVEYESSSDLIWFSHRFESRIFIKSITIG
jgi:hypothetical protein